MQINNLYSQGSESCNSGVIVTIQLHLNRAVAETMTQNSVPANPGTPVNQKGIFEHH